MRAENFAAWILLIAGSVFDSLTKKIPLLLLAAGSIVGIFVGSRASLMDWVYCVLPGIGMLCLSFVTREKIGYGDGAFLCMLGLLIGGGKCITVLMLGLFLGSLAGIVLLLFKKGTVQTKIPFVPFLLFGYIIQSLWR